MADAEVLKTSDSDTYPGYMVRILEMLAAIRANQDNLMTCVDGMSGRVARMEGRAQDLALNVGTLCSQTEHLTKSVESHDKKIGAQEEEIRVIGDAVQQAKGSWRALMIVAGVAAFMASVVSYLIGLAVDLVHLSRGAK